MPNPKSQNTLSSDGRSNYYCYMLLCTCTNASKLIANKTTWEVWQTTKPHYAQLTLHPVFVYGRNPVQASAKGIQGSSHGLLCYTIMTGMPHCFHSQIPVVHIDDVVEAHLKALDAAILDGSPYPLSGQGRTWRDLADVVQQLYPEPGANLILDIKEEFFSTDSTKAQAELGMRWRSWD
ncbi:hypothetical protein IFM58399_09433 [Aspergillus lentulus]|uniref:uncharacterized protein n=1 Tax=Aspergillus lentulus TaxID=293939 RepID=UPI00139501F3|nr:uncharacterized protein IFM58399_09433 [Aspergillus lentulus]GFF52858.1 hypothetical protein IFM58399_09433 [Aspergillus lentulus]